MNPFHFRLSAAKNLSSFQLLPASLITDLLQLFLGLPLFLFPWGFQSRAAFGISPSSFLNVRPIRLHFLFLISTFISSCPVNFHRYNCRRCLQNTKTNSRRVTHPASYSMGIGVLFQRYDGRVLIVATRLQPASRLRRSATIPSLSLYVLISWAVTSSSVYQTWR